MAKWQEGRPQATLSPTPRETAGGDRREEAAGALLDGHPLVAGASTRATRPTAKWRRFPSGTTVSTHPIAIADGTVWCDQDHPALTASAELAELLAILCP